GNWTFVVVTDRDDLDEQAYKEFSAAGVVEEHTRATSTKHLRTLLGEDRRYVFTLIQKFRTERGEQHPVLSDRDDVIVITDEAHRTQYDVLALNMRNALPNAGFIGFTGTPLIAGEEKTKEVFGDYVSIYNYASSTADGATVPLYFENRIPTLKLKNPHFDEDLADVVEQADLDRDLLEQEIAFMRGTDMAVVISQSQNEVSEMAERGIDIRPIRRRMVEEDLEGRFKDAQDPLRLAFVCSMWTTGFDVPSCSTIYLDKPMRNQALMQTITRANRVFPGKNNGLIVAYVDVLSNLHRALAIYASAGALGRGDLPVEEKTALVEEL